MDLPAGLPSGPEQERLVQKMEGAAGMPIYGRKYVAIPASWMSLWKGHCTAQDAPPGPIKTASLSDPDNELLLRRGVVSHCSPGRVHPKRISFCAQCRQVENQDYVLVIDSIFAKLKEWHGVEGPEYARPVVLTADKSTRVDLFPQYCTVKVGL